MSAEMQIIRDDLTRLRVDAIVNAANDRLAPGGGVCGAIHRAAGRELAEACARIGHCDTGDAVITPGFNLPARFVIHTVGPVWHGGQQGEPEQLARCYRSSIALAAREGLDSIAFPAISCGIFGYPPEQAVPVAVGAVREALDEHRGLTQVSFVVLDAELEALYREALSGNQQRQ